MVKYEYLPLSASDRNAEGSDQIQYSPGQPGADSGNDAQAQLPSDRQPVLPNEGGVSSENSGTQAEDALILQETVSVPQPKSDAPAVPLPALFGGVLAALLAGVVMPDESPPRVRMRRSAAMECSTSRDSGTASRTPSASPVRSPPESWPLWPTVWEDWLTAERLVRP